jgi:hypothetical protein
MGRDDPGGFPDRRVFGFVGDTGAGRLSADPLGELAAVHVGEHDVGEDELVEARVLEKHSKRLLPVSGDSSVISERANQPAGRGARGRAALYDENDRRTEEREREWVGREHVRLQNREFAARNPLHDEGGGTSCRLLR